MNLHRLLHTSAMRLALRYAIFYAVATTLGLGLLFWATGQYVDAQMAAGLEQALEQLAQIDRQYGREKLISAIREEQELVVGNDQRFFLLQTAGGKKLAGTLVDWPADLAADKRVRNVWVEDNLIPDQLPDEDEFWPMIGMRLDDGSRLLTAQSVRQAEDLQEFILSVMIIVVLVSVVLSLTLGWFLGNTLLRRIDSINNTAARISAEVLSSRVALSGRDDEFDELAENLNAMLARIERLMAGMRQVADNVAHDLRKPLNRIRSRIEVTLLEEREDREYRQSLEETIRDAETLERTFNALLEIAQVEAGSFRGEWETVDVSALLGSLGELYSDQAEAQHRYFSLEIEENLTLRGNRHLLAQAIGNLLDNALKYTSIGGLIHVSASQRDDELVIRVCDDGPGIATADHVRVFERFVRLAPEHGESGSGLGLSLVKAVATLHHASLVLADNHPGLCVTILFQA